MAAADPTVLGLVGVIGTLAGAVVKLALRRRSNLSQWIREQDARLTKWADRDREDKRFVMTKLQAIDAKLEELLRSPRIVAPSNGNGKGPKKEP
jgi:beta-lactamase regulating signal transducer with metallopeptidase domain